MVEGGQSEANSGGTDEVATQSPSRARRRAQPGQPSGAGSQLPTRTLVLCTPLKLTW
jgi:hypothetical protein